MFSYLFTRFSQPNVFYSHKVFWPHFGYSHKTIFRLCCFLQRTRQKHQKKFIYFSTNNENALDEQMLMCYNIITIELLYGWLEAKPDNWNADCCRVFRDEILFQVNNGKVI